MKGLPPTHLTLSGIVTLCGTSPTTEIHLWTNFWKTKVATLQTPKITKAFRHVTFFESSLFFIFRMKCWRCSQRENKPQWIQTTAFGPKLPQRHIWPQYIEATPEKQPRRARIIYKKFRLSSALPKLGRSPC